MRAGTPSSSSTRNVSSHASREWITSARSSSVRERGSARGTRPPGRRAVGVLVVEVEAGLADRDDPPVARASASRSAPLVVEAATRRGGAARRWRTRRRGARRARPRPAGRRQVGADAHHRHDPGRPGPRTRASASASDRSRLQVAVAVDPASPAGHAPGLDAAGRAGRPSPAACPREAEPHAAASGSRWSSGAPARPSRRHSSAARARDHRRREQRDDAQRLEAVAEHRARPRRCRRPCAAPTARVLDVRVRGADELPHRAEAAPRSRAAPVAAVSLVERGRGGVDERAVRARRRARRRRSSSTAMLSTRFARLPKLLARSAL